MILIKMLGFLVGLCTLIILSSYIKNKQIFIESFENKNREHKPKEDIIIKKYMIISTDVNNISISDQKWYDDRIDMNKINIDDNNNNLYFTFDNIIKKNGTSPVNINGITLKGPQSINFANNDKYLLNECSIFLTLKFNELTNTKNNKNVLFLLSDDSISIIILNNENSTSTVNIIVGDKVHSHPELTNIKNDKITSIDVNMIGLIVSNSKIIFYFNNNSYTFDNNLTKPITLGTNNIIINKDGGLDVLFYNFIYYKNAVPSIDNYNKPDEKKEIGITPVVINNNQNKIIKVHSHKCRSLPKIEPLLLTFNPIKILQDIFDEKSLHL